MSPASAQASYPTEITDMDIRLQPAAQAKLAELLREADPGLDVVRIFVTGGGCGGMSYAMTFGEDVTEFDSVLEGEGFKVAIDAIALNYLSGCEIDFDGGSFVFRNVFQSVGGSGACGGCAGGRGF